LKLKRERKKRILISFVGTNDAGKMTGNSDGAILTVFRSRKYDEVRLIWNESKSKEIDLHKIAKYVKNEMHNRGYCKSVKLHKIELDSVTDHNEIYLKLLAICKKLKLSPDKHFTAAISSGTPAMQVCWILMAESGDFPLELIRSNEPKYGRPFVSPVKLGTGLPRIIRLEKEVQELREEKKQLIPDLIININTGSVKIGNTEIAFSPIEFSYYRYFAERAKSNEPLMRISGIFVPDDFLRSIVRYHSESFPGSDLFRQDLQAKIKKGEGLDVRTFRGNISKANKKIQNSIYNEGMVKLFKISSFGKRHSTSYGLNVSGDKVHIIK
jgi:hypothetical protein